MPKTSQISSFPAPIGGLNVADSLMAMPATDATVMRNMFSRAHGVEIRKGNVRHATGLNVDSRVETVVVHKNSLTNDTDSTRVYAFAGPAMFEITTPGNVARVAVLTGLSADNAIWNGVSVVNASGLNQTLYNGFDDGIWIKDDFAIARIIEDTTGTPPLGSIFGVSPKKLVNGTVHQKRVWLVQKDSTKAWYLAPEAISGAATAFNFGSIFQRGGHLKAVASWTLDSGSGVDDVFVAISSMGDIAIYSGTDPATASTWSLKGVFQTAPPLGARCLTKIDGDLAVLTTSGLMSLSVAMSSGDTSSSDSNDNKYFSSKVQYLIQGLAKDLFSTKGWAVVYWPDNNSIVVNVPMHEGSGQLVQSTLTKGWSQFDGWDAVSVTIHKGILIYGDRKGNVWRAWEGNTDGAIQVDAATITPGEPIVAEVQTSFNFFGSMSAVKHAKMVRPTFIGSSKVQYRIQANPEFSYGKATNLGTATAVSAEGLWGVALWGADKWGAGAGYTQRAWTSVAGIGTGFAIRMAFRSSAPVLWVSYDVMLSEGTGI